MHSLIFSDTDNDVGCVKNTLDALGLLDKKGRVTDRFGGIAVIHTGDLLDKSVPDPAVLDFWSNLRSEAQSKGGLVRIIAGNHELEAWQAIQEGETFGLRKKQLERVCEFIEQLDILVQDGAVLLLHGYPTLAFLRTLEHFTEVTGEPLNRFNDLHFRPAFASVKAIRHYAYLRGKAGEERILCDVAEAATYFKQRGGAVAALLKDLGIDTVIHGHRPQRSGMQADYEFGKWLPGIRMIGNDTKVKQRGFGATVMRVESGERPEVLYLNTKVDSAKCRKKARLLLAVAAVPRPAERVTSGESRQGSISLPSEQAPPEPVRPDPVSPEPAGTEKQPRKPPEPRSPTPSEPDSVIDAPAGGYSVWGGLSLPDPKQAEASPIEPSLSAGPVETGRWPASVRKRMVVGVAVLALFVGLGLYWLVDSYQEERARLLEQIGRERATSTTLRREVTRLTAELARQRGQDQGPQ